MIQQEVAQFQTNQVKCSVQHFIFNLVVVGGNGLQVAMRASFAVTCNAHYLLNMESAFITSFPSLAAHQYEFLIYPGITVPLLWQCSGSGGLAYNLSIYFQQILASIYLVTDKHKAVGLFCLKPSFSSVDGQQWTCRLSRLWLPRSRLSLIRWFVN